MRRAIVAVVALVVVVIAGVVALSGGEDGGGGGRRSDDVDRATAPASAAPSDEAPPATGVTSEPAPTTPSTEPVPDREPPIVLHPCDVVPADDVRSATGVAGSSTRLVDDEPRKVCDYREIDGDAPIVVLEAGRDRDAASLLEEFRNRQADASQVIPLGWGTEGEIRVTADQVSLWSYVVDDDPLGRDLFVQLTISNTADPGRFTVPIEVLAEQLRDALLAARP